MKVLIAKFVLEANANVPSMCDMENVSLRVGNDCTTAMQIGSVFADAGIDVIPSISADAVSAGVMRKRCFEYLEGRILDDIQEHLGEIDSIYLHLHGASEVEDIGSGDHHILCEIRKIVGPYLPIGITCDPHGNLCESYVSNATIIRSYRESPHTDIEETIRFVCNALIDQMRNPTGIKPVYRKLPIIIGGEQSVSADEPVRTINRHLNELEEDPRILSCSWHVGYIRHDTDVAGAGIVVIPSDKRYQDYAASTADELAKYVFNKRHEFHYSGTAAQPDKALSMVLEKTEGTRFLTDSGDNVTSGATGANTYVLRQFLGLEELSQRVLFSAIHDDTSYTRLAHAEVGSQVHISLGAGYDELSKPVDLDVTVLQKGRQEGTCLFGESGDFGGGVRVSVGGTPIEIIVTDTNHPFVEEHQVKAFGTSWNDYDIIVVKTGYAFPDVKAQASLAVMSLTDGATLQDTSRLQLKRIMRPMFPIDDI
jgi:microcystin degradation protein MlrC